MSSSLTLTLPAPKLHSYGRSVTLVLTTFTLLKSEMQH